MDAKTMLLVIFATLFGFITGLTPHNILFQFGAFALVFGSMIFFVVVSGIEKGIWRSVKENGEIIFYVILFFGSSTMMSVAVSEAKINYNGNAQLIAKIQAQKEPTVMMSGKKYVVIAFDLKGGTATVSESKDKAGIVVHLSSIKPYSN
jgi:hypothetical protein